MLPGACATDFAPLALPEPQTDPLPVLPDNASDVRALGLQTWDSAPKARPIDSLGQKLISVNSARPGLSLAPKATRQESLGRKP